MRRWLILAFASLLLLCGVGTTLLIIRSQAQSGIHAVPVYPGASNVQVVDFSSPSNSQVAWGSTSSGSNLGWLLPVIASGHGGNLTFTTSDTPQQIYSYYDTALANAGWRQVGNIGNSVSGANTASSVNLFSSLRAYIYSSPFPLLPFFGKSDPVITLTTEDYTVPGSTTGHLTLMEQ